MLSTGNKWSAARLVTRGQVTWAVGILIGFAAAGGALGLLAVLLWLVAVAVALSVASVAFRLLIWQRAATARPRAIKVPDVTDPDLPTYTILLPLLREA